MEKLSIPDQVEIITEEKIESDASVRFEQTGEGFFIYLKASLCRPKKVILRWKAVFSPNALFLGDAWERSYADLGWKSAEESGVMPWYFLCLEDKTVTAAGVRVRPSSLVGWRVGAGYISAELDVRCGGEGVSLAGRELCCAEILSECYDLPPFEAACDFCGRMCPDPLLPEKPVYGGNNWYYAYGKSSRRKILNDARYQSFLAGDSENRPFMVVDDGWQINSHDHTCPWKPKRRFGDMGRLAADMKSVGVRPGLWIRYLSDVFGTLPKEWTLPRTGASDVLDPSLPETLGYIKELNETITGWGYEMIKHDFTTYDTTGAYAFTRPENPIEDGWSFHDKSRTTAEIVKDLYKTILDSAGGTLILGCNTFSHLCAGLVHLNRIGDDTSGKDWDRVCRYGVNALAFRLPQHNRFYAVDADCVGVLSIPWKQNKLWLELLSKSGTPLFVSCAKDSFDAGDLPQVKSAYARAAVQSDILKPADSLSSRVPERWEVNGEPVVFRWNEP